MELFDRVRRLGTRAGRWREFAASGVIISRAAASWRQPPDGRPLKLKPAHFALVRPERMAAKQERLLLTCGRSTQSAAFSNDARDLQRLGWLPTKPVGLAFNRDGERGASAGTRRAAMWSAHPARRPFHRHGNRRQASRLQEPAATWHQAKRSQPCGYGASSGRRNRVRLPARLHAAAPVPMLAPRAPCDERDTSMPGPMRARCHGAALPQADRARSPSTSWMPTTLMHFFPGPRRARQGNAPEL